MYVTKAGKLMEWGEVLEPEGPETLPALYCLSAVCLTSYFRLSETQFLYLLFGAILAISWVHCELWVIYIYMQFIILFYTLFIIYVNLCII